MERESEVLRLFGTSEAPPPRRRLAAGALECHLCDGSLQEVRWHGVEVIRGISYLLRDQDWGTIPARLGQVSLLEADDEFAVSFGLTMETPQGVLCGHACIHGDATGRLDFEVSATPGADLQTNRCGFVVLHPASVAGRPLTVEHTNGAKETTLFPREISPSQPVFDIRALSVSPAEGVVASCRLEAELPGDPMGKFEMEDQRNWSDASFKTYVASLLDPWPYVLPAGKSLVQRVSLTVSGRPSGAVATAADLRLIRFGPAGDARMPAIGVGVPPGFARARSEEIAALHAVAASWWIVEAALDDDDLLSDLAAVATERGSTATRVQLDVIVPSSQTPNDAALKLAQLADDAGLSVDALRLLPEPYLKSYQPSDEWPRLPTLEQYASAARACFPKARIGGGMFTSFTELNRKRPLADGLDFIGHLTTPIVHAPDDVSVMQTIETLPHIVRSVRKLWPTLGYRLGPTTIAMRRNPYGDAVAVNKGCTRLTVADRDPRHCAAFGAAWTVAYAAAVAQSELEVLALHESHGVRGPLTANKQRIPAWIVLSQLAEAVGAPVVPTPNLPTGIACVAWLSHLGLVQGLVANTSTKPATLRWEVATSINGELPRSETVMQAMQVASISFACSR